MTAPVLHLLAGPNGAGKTTFVRSVLWPVTRLPFINADEIAAQTWPGDEAAHAYDAARAAEEARHRAMVNRTSFISETVFSHPSKLELVEQAVSQGYIVTLHVIMVPEEVSVRRVEYRVGTGGHTVPEDKIRHRHRRLWTLVAHARDLVGRCRFYDNTRAAVPFRLVAEYEHGRPLGAFMWPSWTPAPLIQSTTRRPSP